MHLRSGKDLKEMARPKTSGTSASSSQSNAQSSQAQSAQASAPTVSVNVSTVIGVTAPMPVSTVMGLTASTSVSTTTALTQSDLVASVPPSITFPLIAMDTNHQIRTSLDNKFLSMQQFTMSMVTREYPYDMPTTMMAGLQTNASIYADNTIVFTPYNTHFPSRSSMPG